MKYLLFSFTFFLSTTFAHSIPPELLEFMANNPDATNQQLQSFWDQSGLEGSTELWAGDDNPETFNMPAKLVQFLLDNPEANEPEILNFLEANPTLKDAGWAEKIATLSGGQGFEEDNPFSLNDLVLLSELGEKFDKVYAQPETLNWWQFAKNYVVLGIEHILAGLDHILFVMSLVLLLPSGRRILAMVTTFTVAHSLTLILGGTNVLTLSGKIVEPLIAASIAYMAITTVFLSKKYPWFAKNNASLGVIFLFGLFHGLGFAGVFAEVAPQIDRLLPSLLFFNIGVEIGQLLILAVFVPFLWSLKHFKIDRYFVPAFAGLISLLAGWWVIVRVLF